MVSRDSCCFTKSEATRSADSAAATSELLRERMQATSAALGAIRYLKCCLHLLEPSQEGGASLHGTNAQHLVRPNMQCRS